VRTMMKWAAIPALLLAVACQDKAPDSDLASDLKLITGSDVELANAAAGGATVVSAIENIPAPAPKTSPTPSKKRGHAAPPPEAVMVDAAADEPVTTAPEMVTVSVSDEPVAAEVPAPDAPPVIRPHPVEPRYPVGSGSVYGSGREEGAGTGGRVVIRGGTTGDDPCAVHDRRGRRRPGVGIVINSPIPGIGTFPRY
jgi:hypothetical protein